LARKAEISLADEVSKTWLVGLGWGGVAYRTRHANRPQRQLSYVQHL